MVPAPEMNSNPADSTGEKGAIESVVSGAKNYLLDPHPIPQQFFVVPYKGLNPYSEADAEIFFGRTRDTQRIVNKLLAWRLTVLYGESGVGKSSVLRAGVIHTLREEAQQNLEDYGFPKLAVAIFPPLQGERFWQQEPLQSLVQQIDIDMTESGIQIDPSDSELSFVETLQNLTLQLGGDGLEGRLFIILDQFEEYFQYHPLADKEESFITEVSKAINFPDLHVNFLISLREDSYAKLDRLRGQIPGILDICLSIEHLDRESAREAITGPVAKYNQEVSSEQTVEIASDLVDALLQGIPRVKQGSEGLAGLEKQDPTLENQILAPYLQLVMTRLWDEMVKADSHHLDLKLLTRLADQNTVGDEAKIISAITNIVQEHIATTMQSLPAKQQDIAVESFRYLVTPSGTKYAYSVADLTNLVGCNATDLHDLFKQLAREQRIIRPVGPSPDQPDVQRYEIFHDFLASAILQWRRQYLEKRQEKDLEKVKTGLENLIALMNSLSPREQDLAAKSFSFLVTPLGTRITYAVADLASQVECVPVELNPLLEKLARDHIVRPVEPSSDKPDSQRYEVFHDVLAPAVLEWRRLYLERRQIEQEQKEHKQKEKRKMLVAFGLGTLVLGSGLFAGILAYQRKADLLTAQIQQSLQQFETAQQLDALQQAIHNGQQVQSWVQQNPLNLLLGYRKDQSIVQTTGTLQQILLSIQEQNQFSIPAEQNFRLDLSPDWRAIATASFDGNVQVWEWPTGKLLISFQASGPLLDVSFSIDSQTLVTVSTSGEVQQWNWQTGKRLAEPLPTVPSEAGMVFSPRSQTFAIALEEESVQVWNWQTGERRATVSPGHERFEKLLNFALSPDGQTLAITFDNGTVQMWDGQTGKELVSFSTSGQVWNLDFSPDGKTLATATDEGRVQLWDWRTGQEQFEPVLTSQTVTSLGFSPDGNTLAIATVDSKVQLWSLHSAQLSYLVNTFEPTAPESSLYLVNTFEVPDPVSRLWFSKDSQQIATISGENDTIRFWNTKGPLITLPGTTIIVFSPNGQQVATTSATDYNARLWNTQGKLLATLRGHEAPVTSIAFSPSGQQIVTASYDSTARLWDTQGNLQASLKHDDAVTSVAFSPDGRQVATASTDSNAYLWDTQGQILHELTGHQNTVTSVAFSPNGRQIATTSADKTARLWDTQGKLQVTLKQDGATNSITFSPDGRQIATASADKTARLWDIKGHLQATLTGHQDTVTSVAFSPNGQQMATASTVDNTVRFWDTRGRLLVTLPGATGIAFSPSGQQVAIISMNGVASIAPVELQDLLAQGCQWLEPYLESHPNKGKDQYCSSIP